MQSACAPPTRGRSLPVEDVQGYGASSLRTWPLLFFVSERRANEPTLTRELLLHHSLFDQGGCHLVLHLHRTIGYHRDSSSSTAWRGGGRDGLGRAGSPGATPNTKMATLTGAKNLSRGACDDHRVVVEEQNGGAMAMLEFLTDALGLGERGHLQAVPPSGRGP